MNTSVDIKGNIYIFSTRSSLIASENYGIINILDKKGKLTYSRNVESVVSSYRGSNPIIYPYKNKFLFSPINRGYQVNGYCKLCYMNKLGQVIWANSYMLPDFYIALYDFVTDSLGFMYMVNITNDEKAQTVLYTGAVISKLDTNGKVIWSRSLKRNFRNLVLKNVSDGILLIANTSNEIRSNYKQ